MAPAHHLILVGGTGTGKPHLATAREAAIHLGTRVRFDRAVDLVNQRETETRLGPAGHLAQQRLPIDAVILDERGDRPFPASGGTRLVHPIGHLDEKTAPILAAHLRVGEWGRSSATPS